MAMTIRLPKRAEQVVPEAPKAQPVIQEVKKPEVTPKEPINEKELDNG